MNLAADLHLRRTPPRARKDDYWAAQERKFWYICESAQRDDSILLVAGDFFHQPKPGPYVESWVIEVLRETGIQVFVTPGQHDLPYHSLAELKDSGLGVLQAAGVISVLTTSSDLPDYISGVSYGETPPKRKTEIMMWHHMVIQDDPLWPDQVADTAGRILRLHPEHDLILTGDNHQTFMAERNGCYLVNPGSMMRMTVGQVNHKPSIFKWPETGPPIQLFLPAEDDVLDLTQKEEDMAIDERIADFTNKLSLNYETGLNFRRNVEEFMQANKIKPSVAGMVWRAIG